MDQFYFMNNTQLLSSLYPSIFFQSQGSQYVWLLAYVVRDLKLTRKIHLYPSNYRISSNRAPQLVATPRQISKL